MKKGTGCFIHDFYPPPSPLSFTVKIGITTLRILSDSVILELFSMFFFFFLFFQDNSINNSKNGSNWKYRRLINLKNGVKASFVNLERQRSKFLEVRPFNTLNFIPLDFTSQPALMHGTCGRVNLFTCIHRSTQPTLWSVIRVHFTVNCRVSSSTRAQRTPAFLRTPHPPFRHHLVLQMLLSALRSFMQFIYIEIFTYLYALFAGKIV